MDEPKGLAAPASGTSDFSHLTDDPEILALLDFEPAPRKRDVDGAWTPALQCEFIVRLAITGSIGRAAEEMGKTDSGVRKLYRSPEAASFRAAWDAAIALAKRRKRARTVTETVVPGSRPPSLDNRRKHHDDLADADGGAWEDEDTYRERFDEVKQSMCRKLLNARRLYLQEISDSPGKRAAFEILTELPVDWALAETLQPQPFEPWRRTNQREPDMILTAESGWSAGEFGYGPDRKAEARREMDRYRAEQGLPAIDWDAPEKDEGE